MALAEEQPIGAGMTASRPVVQKSAEWRDPGTGPDHDRPRIRILRWTKMLGALDEYIDLGAEFEAGEMAGAHALAGGAGRRLEAHDSGGDVHLGRVLERTRRDRVQPRRQRPQYLQPLVESGFDRVTGQQVESLAPPSPFGEVGGVVDRGLQIVGRMAFVHEPQQVRRDAGDVQSPVQSVGKGHRLLADSDLGGAVKAGELEELGDGFGRVVGPHAERVAGVVLQRARWQVESDAADVLVGARTTQCDVADDCGAKWVGSRI